MRLEELRGQLEVYKTKLDQNDKVHRYTMNNLEVIATNLKSDTVKLTGLDEELKQRVIGRLDKALREAKSCRERNLSEDGMYIGSIALNIKVALSLLLE